jgi:hypothetical protein
MTATISRLYNNYADAREAVRNLEAAGVGHNDINILASNADNWYSSDRKEDTREPFPDRDLDARMTGRRLLELALESARQWAVPRACSRGSASWPFRRWSRCRRWLAGIDPCRAPLAALQAVSLARSHKLVLARRMPISMPKVCAAARRGQRSGAGRRCVTVANHYGPIGGECAGTCRRISASWMAVV